MFNKDKEQTDLEFAIDNAFQALRGHAVGDKEYVVVLSQIVKLHELKQNEKPKRVSPDTLALITANLVGIIMIIAYENAHVITSKALNTVPRLL